MGSMTSSWVEQVFWLWILGFGFAGIIDGWRGSKSQPWTVNTIVLWTMVPFVPFLILGVLLQVVFSLLRGTKQ